VALLLQAVTAVAARFGFSNFSTKQRVAAAAGAISLHNNLMDNS
jgi:hypothetical protein